jgi:hypothetical protein
MAAGLDVHQKHRAVIKFFCCENETVGNIDKRLKNVYGDDAIDCSTVSQLGPQIMPIFGIFLAPADHTPHKHLTVCSVLTIWF